MRIDIFTIFPDAFSYLNLSLIGEAIEKKIVDLHIHNIRDFSKDKNKKVDDEPYGGGFGMLFKVEPLVNGVEYIESIGRGKLKPYKILLSPKGKLLNQKKLIELKDKEWLILICPRYEGVDERVLNFVDEEISIGDYILSGGELPAMVLIEGILRLKKGILGNENSLKEESFTENLLEPPQYTRPEIFRALKVPKILLSGDPKKIQKWKRFMALKITYKKRKDLIIEKNLSDLEKKILRFWEERDGNKDS